jgi:hypothetical protein
MVIRERSHIRTVATLLTLLAAGIGACSINPVSKLPEVTLITVEQEKKIGEEEAKKVEQEMGLLDDPALSCRGHGRTKRLRPSGRIRVRHPGLAGSGEHGG